MIMGDDEIGAAYVVVSNTGAILNRNMRIGPYDVGADDDVDLMFTFRENVSIFILHEKAPEDAGSVVARYYVDGGSNPNVPQRNGDGGTYLLYESSESSDIISVSITKLRFNS